MGHWLTAMPAQCVRIAWVAGLIFWRAAHSNGTCRPEPVIDHRVRGFRIAVVRWTAARACARKAALTLTDAM